MARNGRNIMQPNGKITCMRCKGEFDESHFYIYKSAGKTTYTCKDRYLNAVDKETGEKLPRNSILPDGRIYCSKCDGIFEKDHFTITTYPGRVSSPNTPITQVVCKKNDKRLSIENPNRKYNSNYKHDPSNYRKDVKLQREYGITLDQFNEKFSEQNGCCAICGIPQMKLDRTLFVDHCHKTGKFRGLLCGKCNTAIGMLQDNPEIIKKAALYVEKYV